MKELAIQCTIYVQNPDGWNEDNPEDDAFKVLQTVENVSTINGSWSFEWQIYDAEIREV